MKLTQSIAIKDTSGSRYILSKGSTFEIVDKKRKKQFPLYLEKYLEKHGYRKFVEGFYSYAPEAFESYMSDEDMYEMEDEFDGVEEEFDYYTEDLDTINEPNLVSNQLPGVTDEEDNIPVEKPSPEEMDDPNLQSNWLPAMDREEDNISIENPTPDNLPDPNLVSNNLPGMTVVEGKKIIIPSNKDFDRFLK